MTQSDLEKKRCPPRSMRLPRYSIVLEIPPTWESASMTIGCTPELRCNSTAAVSPAGPAPTMTAVLCISASRKSLRGGETREHQTAPQQKVGSERAARGRGLGEQVVQVRVFGRNEHHGGIDHQPHEAQRDEQRQLQRRMRDSPEAEYEPCGDKIQEYAAQRERDGRGRYGVPAGLSDQEREHTDVHGQRCRGSGGVHQELGHR